MDFCVLLGGRLLAVPQAVAEHPWWPEGRPKASGLCMLASLALKVHKQQLQDLPAGLSCGMLEGAGCLLLGVACCRCTCAFGAGHTATGDWQASGRTWPTGGHHTRRSSACSCWQWAPSSGSLGALYIYMAWRCLAVTFSPGKLTRAGSFQLQLLS